MFVHRGFKMRMEKVSYHNISSIVLRYRTHDDDDANGSHGSVGERFFLIPDGTCRF